MKESEFEKTIAFVEGLKKDNESLKATIEHQKLIIIDLNNQLKDLKSKR